jgi:hypothetical protein
MTFPLLPSEAIACLILLSGLADAAPESTAVVTNGRSDFSICPGAQASPLSAAMADTLRRYLREISGADVPVTRTLRSRGQQIVFEIGRSRDPDCNVPALGHDGFRIWTSSGNVYITSGSDYGLQNGVYTFLEQYLGCRKYSPTVTIIPKRESIVLSKIDDVQVPPLTFRMQDFHDPGYAAWHKLNSQDEFGLFVHTFNTLVPPETYFEQHPEYYSLLNGHRTAHGQLCLTNPDVFRIVVRELRSRMAAKPGATFWSVSQNDTYVPCDCEACRAIDAEEGSPSGSLLAFVNRVADEFPDMTISTLAYQYSRAAPKHLRPRPNVNIMLCSIECNRSRPIAVDPGSASFVQDVEDWSRLTRNILLWDYVIQFRNLVSPFPNLRVLQPNMQFFVKSGVTSVFEQGLAQMKGEFAELRAYLISKLLWDPYVDLDAVMNDFLQGYYGKAAPFLRRYIDTMHDALETSGEALSIYGYPAPTAKGYLAPGRFASYDPLFHQAEAAVGDDEAMLLRVRTARLPLQFARLEQAKMSGVAERGFFVESADGSLQVRPELDSLLTVFVRRCKEAGIPRLWEHGTSPDEYYTSTRRFLDQSAGTHLARGRSVTLARPASPKYHSGDAGALTDGLKGWDDYHWHWLGFEGEDMEATVDLGSSQVVSKVRMDFLQDINSWVFMPLTVGCSISDDGRDFRSIGKVATGIPADRDGAIIEPFAFTSPPSKARYVKVRAVSRKTCPPWHKGAGGQAWIFIDEIAVW